MPTCQTVVFENVEIDVSNNKQLFIHPIHRVIAEAFPVNINFAILSCCYDLRPGNYGCTHTFMTPDKKKKLIDYKHENVRLDAEGGVMGFRTPFENVMIEQPGKYWIRTDVSGGVKAEDILIRVEEKKAGAPRLNVKA